jgi:hypothetical protein
LTTFAMTTSVQHAARVGPPHHRARCDRRSSRRWHSARRPARARRTRLRWTDARAAHAPRARASARRGGRDTAWASHRQGGRPAPLPESGRIGARS